MPDQNVAPVPAIPLYLNDRDEARELQTLLRFAEKHLQAHESNVEGERLWLLSKNLRERIDSIL